MARITSYMISLTVIFVLFSLTGLLLDTPVSTLINTIINPQDLATKDIFLTVLGIATVIAIATVTIGLISPGKIDIVILAPVVTLLLTEIIFEFVTLFGVVQNYVGTPISLLLFSPLIMAFLFDAISWWMGRT